MRALDGPVVVPAQGGAQDRREELEQAPVGVDLPVEADVGAVVGVLAQRPDAGAAEVAVGLAVDAVRAVRFDRLRAGVQVVGQAALEVLERVLALGLDADVDRLPPLGVGVAVGEDVEDRLGVGLDVPLVDERVLRVDELEQREVAQEPEAVAGRGEAEAVVDLAEAGRGTRRCRRSGSRRTRIRPVPAPCGSCVWRVSGGTTIESPALRMWVLPCIRTRIEPSITVCVSVWPGCTCGPRMNPFGRPTTSTSV